MKKRITLLTFIVCFTCTISVSVAAVKAVTDSTTTSESRLPVIGVGYGALTFIGDIGNSGYNQPLFYRGGFQMEVQLHTKSNIEFFFNILAGKLYGEEKSVTENLNFTSNIFVEAVNVRYAFNFKKYPKQVLIPFISVGIENISFNPYTDLKDANGNIYNYWSDGTIRNMPETSADVSQSKVLHRDYNYETNIHDANVTGLGDFSRYALVFPVSVGVKFKVSNRVALHFTETYHITTTNKIDGDPTHSTANDKILYSAVSFHYDLSAARETPKRVHLTQAEEESLYKDVDYSALENADTDGDGVPDFMDEDNSTPKGVKVDAHGRAIDSDGDGVPDYRDKEANSPSGTRVDENGITITDSLQEAKYIKDSLDLEIMSRVERVKSQNVSNINGATGNRLPEEFKSVDTNNDGVISADEVAKAIEQYNAGKSPFKKKQFYKLIDYFFGQ